MKTPEEWMDEYATSEHNNWLDLIKQIQLDALKEGMTKAATMCYFPGECPSFTEMGNRIQESSDNLKNMKTLELTLKKRWFDEIKAGNKKEEYRTPSPWIFARLEGRQYDAVRFRNGYSTTSPTVTLEYKGYELGFGDRRMGAPEESCVIIKLGNIINETP